MKNPHFRLQHGTIYLFDGVEMITGYRRLAFGVDLSDPDSGTMMKYGEEEMVQAWHKETVDKLTKVDPRWAKGICVIAQDNWPIEEIDKFINNTGYIGSWIKRNLPDLLTPSTRANTPC